MTCADATRLLDAYVDNELDLRSALELEEHIASCPGCDAEERKLRELQTAARSLLTRYEPSPQLEARFRAAARPARVRRWPRYLAPAAAAAVLVMVGVSAPHFASQPSENSVADAVIAAHVRSLLANHLTDVASSDQHTVKPWFQGKLDYSVSVTDWASEGFPLVGGRLDYIENTPAASLVYKRAQHVVNLFVWPGKRGFDEPLHRLALRGYNAFTWSKDGMHYWVVSDLNVAELEKFVELARR